MFCIKCGKEIKEGAKFCSSCGAAVENNSAAKEELHRSYSNLKAAVKNRGVKYYTGIIFCIIAFIISLFPLIYNSGLSEYGAEEEDWLGEHCMNGNILMLLRVYKYCYCTMGLFENASGYGAMAVLVFIIGCIVVTVLGVMAIKKFVKAVKRIDSEYDVSVELSRDSLIHLMVIGIISICIALWFNLMVNAMVNKMVNSVYQSSYYEDMDDYYDAKEEAKDDLHDTVDEIKYSVSIPAVLLVIVGFVGAKLIDKFTYPYVETARKIRRSTASSNLSQIRQESENKFDPNVEWRCEECGKINSGKKTSCVNCYHKREY